MTFTHRQKREAVLREIKMRKRVYPSQVRQETMTQEEAPPDRRDGGDCGGL